MVLSQFKDADTCYNKKMVLEQMNNYLLCETEQHLHNILYAEVRVGINKLRTFRKFKNGLCQFKMQRCSTQDRDREV